MLTIIGFTMCFKTFIDFYTYDPIELATPDMIAATQQLFVKLKSLKSKRKVVGRMTLVLSSQLLLRKDLYSSILISYNAYFVYTSVDRGRELLNKYEKFIDSVLEFRNTVLLDKYANEGLEHRIIKLERLIQDHVGLLAKFEDRL